MATPQSGEEVAVMQTNKGRIVIGFLPDKAPNHVANFKKLSSEGFYDGLKFHRVIPGFMIQGGCPNTRDGASGMPGTGNPGYSIDAEFNDTKHLRGILSMARSSNPNSAGSQFFIMVANAPHLDGQYSAFGYVVEGMETADEIVALRGPGDAPTEPCVIETVTVTPWPLEN
ncbi:MAG: peptidylprolyl isomerase [Armatimonadetes bacterium]|nr:peptidylprolyl isomerase [Armatimonadota bacterium]MBS1701616.1 peptidylprolyl isomerase [Armatimonadota bacterium]MBS1726325.1 peptidylprolyl isomerase [Armatimonadota bacterium]